MASLLNNASLLLNPAGSIIAYEEDKIFSVLPSNGTGDFTFSGGDGGTRVNQQGYIEQTPANIFTYSETFTNGVWQYGAVTATDNQVIAPNGTQTGALMTISAGGHYFRQNVTVVPGGIYTLSFYAKRGTASDLAYSVYDLTNGANIIAATSYYSQTNSSEWSRISVTFTAPAGCVLAGCYPTRDGGATGTFYLWGAMVNIGSTAKPYQPTTDRLNYPRITYQNGRGALLNEPQKTNLVLYSQQFNVGWTLYQGASLTPSASLSPDGTQNAFALNVATLGYSGIYQSTGGGTIEATTSIFAKKGTLDWILMVDSAGSAGRAWFNLANGTIGTVTGGWVAKIEPFKDGWYRCILQNPSATIFGFQIGASTGDNVVTPATTGNIYIYGAQLEAQRYASSYIPTTSATVTRPTGNVRKTGVSSYIGQTEGTLYTDFVLGDQWETGATGTDQNLLTISDGSYNNVVMTTVYPAVGNILMYAVVGNSIQVNNAITGILVPGRRYKTALAYKQNDYALYLNGVQISTDTSATVPACSQADITQNLFGGSQFSNPPGTAAIFTSRLTNTQLAELTTVRSGSGGTISYYGPYTIHTFTGSATFTPSFNGQVEVLVVAGGGSGGGQGGNDGSGGGGAGGLLYVSSYGVSQGTGITVTIGAGGAGVGGGTTGNNGSNSVFGGLTAIGGGGGGSEASAEARNGRPGGSGGGAGGYSLNHLGGAGITGQGNKGGDNKQTGGGGINYGGGGGGGAGAPGQDGNNTVVGQLGLGGDGLPYSISGFSTYYAGGGGCGGGYSATGSAGGLGGGGKGGDSATGRATGTPGVNYTGGGGGGAGGSAVGGSGNSGTGGAGVVIVRYLT
jgi:hypothetical protein